jgi:HSP20 family protein
MNHNTRGGERVSALVPFRPFADLLDLEREFDRAAGRFFGGPARTWAVAPRMDVRDAGDRLEVVVEMPGFQPEDVDVSVEHGVLTITANHAQTTPDEGEPKRNGYVWRERRSSSLRRQVRLPEGVRSDQIAANLENGLLTVGLPRTNQESAVRIPVGGSAALSGEANGSAPSAEGETTQPAS